MTKYTRPNALEIGFIKNTYSELGMKPEYIGFLLGRNSKSIRRIVAGRGFKKAYRPTIRLDQLTSEDIAYIAGMVDADGGIGWHQKKQKRGGRVYVTNTDRGLINWLLQIGGKVWETTNDRSVIKSTKPMYRWEIRCKADVKALLELIIPHLIIKRERAVEVLKAVS